MKKPILWSLGFAYLFLLIRLILNLSLEPLTIYFAVMYTLFLIMLYKRAKMLRILLILFLAIDNMFATFFATFSSQFGPLFLGTVLLNFLFLLLVLLDPQHVFE